MAHKAVACPKGHVKATRHEQFLCHGHRFATKAHALHELPGAARKLAGALPHVKAVKRAARRVPKPVRDRVTKQVGKQFHVEAQL